MSIWTKCGIKRDTMQSCMIGGVVTYNQSTSVYTTCTFWSSRIVYRRPLTPFVVTFPRRGWKELMIYEADRMIINTHRNHGVINRDERKRWWNARRWASVVRYTVAFRRGISIAKEHITGDVNIILTATISAVQELNYTVDSKSSSCFQRNKRFRASTHADQHLNCASCDVLLML